METKKTYESPTTEVVKCETQKILCGSKINPLYFMPFEGGGEDW